MGLAGTQPGGLLGEVDGGEAAEQRRKGMRNRRGIERPDQRESVKKRVKTSRVS